MSTATLTQPETELHTDEHLVHWACLLQSDSPPLLSLCGDLPVEQRRKPGSKVTCPRCLPLIGPHITTCGVCGPFGGRYR